MRAIARNCPQLASAADGRAIARNCPQHSFYTAVRLSTPDTVPVWALLVAPAPCKWQPVRPLGAGGRLQLSLSKSDSLVIAISIEAP